MKSDHSPPLNPDRDIPIASPFSVSSLPIPTPTTPQIPNNQTNPLCFSEPISPMAATTHRKLFPMSATAANQSLDCPDFCDPACPYNCPYPDFYFLPPPPPPENHSLHFSLAAIVSVSVLAGVFLVLSYYVIIKRFRNGDPGATRSNDSEEFLEDGYHRVDHPVWFIATAGLRPAVINSITVCRYKKNDGLVEGTECSVCLAEFREDETLRIMPKCNHAFHIPCIDTWLRSHTNCPLCRASIVSEPVVAATPPAEAETQIGNSVDGGRAGTEDETEVPKDENGDSVVISIGVEDEQGCEDEVRQPPRRSVSVHDRGEECSSGSDKGTLNGVEKSDT